MNSYEFKDGKKFMVKWGHMGIGMTTYLGAIHTMTKSEYDPTKFNIGNEEEGFEMPNISEEEMRDWYYPVTDEVLNLKKAVEDMIGKEGKEQVITEEKFNNTIGKLIDK